MKQSGHQTFLLAEVRNASQIRHSLIQKQDYGNPDANQITTAAATGKCQKQWRLLLLSDDRTGLKQWSSLSENSHRRLEAMLRPQHPTESGLWRLGLHKQPLDSNRLLNFSVKKEKPSFTPHITLLFMCYKGWYNGTALLPWSFLPYETKVYCNIAEFILH